VQCNDCDVLFYYPISTGDGKFYDELQSYAGYYLDEKSEFLEAAKFITEQDRILEIGCGRGVFTDFIKCKEYTGLEFSEEAIIQAQKKGLNVLNQSLEEHGVKWTGAYDVVCFFQVLEHVESPSTFLRNALKVLRPGGLLILAVPSDDSFIKRASNFYLNMPPHHVTRWSDKALLSIASIFGLTIRKIYHEKLLEIHKLFYLKTVIFEKISHYPAGVPAIDIGTKSRIQYILSSLIAILIRPFKNTDTITGQSVLAVYQKKLEGE
jgi:2-polyprenyl-3-methyl-5-hydroxy-6-metoxy-1,4-benzoquinol methylase